MGTFIFNNRIQIIALIPAAGTGSRMKAKFPKQYLQVAGKTIIEHSILALLKQPRISQIVILLNKNDTFFHQLTIAKNSKIKTIIGGSHRADSVLAGLNYLSNISFLSKKSWVLVHDAVRPCLHQSDLDNIIHFIDSKESFCGGILATPVRDTIKRSIQGRTDISYTVERKELWHALTPQFFPLKLVKKCLEQALTKNIVITDEASALEYCGYHPRLLEGRIDNLKVTRPEDLMLVEFYLSHIL